MPNPRQHMAEPSADVDPSDGLEEHNADVWAMSYGFRDAADMKAEGERMEREHLAELGKRTAQEEPLKALDRGAENE